MTNKSDFAGVEIEHYRKYVKCNGIFGIPA